MSEPIILDDFCRGKSCKFYIEWELEMDYPDCVSCTRVGQSYNIDKIYFDCPHLDEIVEYKRTKNVEGRCERKRIHQEIMWCKLKPFIRATTL